MKIMGKGKILRTCDFIPTTTATTTKSEMKIKCDENGPPFHV